MICIENLVNLKENVSHLNCNDSNVDKKVLFEIIDLLIDKELDEMYLDYIKRNGE